MDKKISYSVIEFYGVLSESSKKWIAEFNLISWNGAKPKYDIRYWSPDHKIPGKGVTLTKDEARVLYDALRFIFEHEEEKEADIEYGQLHMDI